jgi:hypothetical protein
MGAVMLTLFVVLASGGGFGLFLMLLSLAVL